MKKVVKLMFLVLMFLGIAFSIYNFIATDLYALECPCKEVAYLPGPPDCRGLGSTCCDCT